MAVHVDIYHGASNVCGSPTEIASEHPAAKHNRFSRSGYVHLCMYVRGCDLKSAGLIEGLLTVMGAWHFHLTCVTYAIM
jgi:hypothetical protein